MSLGHRKRIRNLFRKAKFGTTREEHLLEMLLFQVFSRRDTNKLAKSLLGKYTSLKTIFHEYRDIKDEKNIGTGVEEFFAVISELFYRCYMYDSGIKRITLDSCISVIRYCELKVPHESCKILKILTLNEDNMLIASDVIGVTIDGKSKCDEEEFLRLAVARKAVSVVMVHYNCTDMAYALLIIPRLYDMLHNTNIKILDYILITSESSLSLFSSQDTFITHKYLTGWSKY
ncbi:putative RadC-like family protein [Candidatus Fokinia solitaria]|uniref:Putative RadC-like family protein n=1 Tax=Candidatus Fokinia solitaria TaxID=1802984 RepID=A0A2U8BR67_9RICK|nr:JAB domain-containing protein [Candidatus Fokinia solitaria]AWD32832.1 putative RadC-like family protein [Candidatus Fokinia solitaria]